MVAAFWFLWALRTIAEKEREHPPIWWRPGILMLGAFRRLAAGLLLGFGWSKPQPKTCGKSLGQAAGTTIEPRKRFKTYRKAAN